MNLNFTPFFTKLGKYKPDPAVSIITGMFVLAVTVAGFNSFSNQLASISCTTSSTLSEMIASQVGIKNQISGLDNQINANNDLIVQLNSSLLNKITDITKITSYIASDYTVSLAKQKANASYIVYLRNKNRPTLNVYNAYSAAYNTLITNNNSYKSQLTTLNSDKSSLEAQLKIANDKSTVLSSDLTKLQNDLNTLTASIDSAKGNICATSITGVVTTTSTYTSNTATGFCSDASDCAPGNNCMVGRCATPGSDLCNNDGDCHQGDRCEAGNCVNIPNVDEDTSVCNDVGACNKGSVGACVFTNCNSDMTNSCTSEYDEMGWRVKFGFGGISITNEDETNGCSFIGNRACDPGWTAFDWAPDLNDRTAGYSYWGCRTTEYNCVTKKNERREVTGCSFYTGR